MKFQQNAMLNSRYFMETQSPLCFTCVYVLLRVTARNSPIHQPHGRKLLHAIWWIWWKLYKHNKQFKCSSLWLNIFSLKLNFFSYSWISKIQWCLFFFFFGRNYSHRNGDTRSMPIPEHIWFLSLDVKWFWMTNRKFRNRNIFRQVNW